MYGAASPSVTYRFVDCRWELGKPDRGRDLYREGHIPGAAFLDVDRDLSAQPGGPEGGRHPLPSAERFAAAASHVGIGPGVFVVAYGNGGGAQRLWWLLRHFGHEDVAALAGGIDAWLGPLRRGDEEIDPADFVARPRTGDTVDAEEILDRRGELVLVDARVPERYRGEPNPIDAVAGRIPGAVNAPWNERVPDLPQGELVAYCGSGVTACVVLHRLHLRGRQGRLYPGSWSEWSARGLPAEKG